MAVDVVYGVGAHLLVYDSLAVGVVLVLLEGDAGDVGYGHHVVVAVGQDEVQGAAAGLLRQGGQVVYVLVAV